MGAPPGFSVSATSYINTWAMTGVKYNLPYSENVKIYGTGQIGILFSKRPDITISLGDVFSETSNFPFLIPGTIAWIVGLYLGLEAVVEYNKPVAPFQAAAEVADEYNKKIINELIISTLK